MLRPQFDDRFGHGRRNLQSPGGVDPSAGALAPWVAPLGEQVWTASKNAPPNFSGRAFTLFNGGGEGN